MARRITLCCLADPGWAAVFEEPVAVRLSFERDDLFSQDARSKHRSPTRQLLCFCGKFLGYAVDTLSWLIHVQFPLYILSAHFEY